MAKAENFLYTDAIVKTDTLHELIWTEVVQPHFSAIPAVVELLLDRLFAFLQHVLFLITFCCQSVFASQDSNSFIPADAFAASIQKNKQAMVEILSIYTSIPSDYFGN